jgi:hypothetical protein
MPLEAHWSRQHSPLGARERRVAVALLAALAACAAVLVLALAGTSGGSAPGCVDATIASTTGGAAVHACGDTARRMCAAPGRTREIRVACRRAGY